MLIEAIGTPAMLEQTAEEATELAFACLKLARHLRGENKVHGRTEEEMISNLEEELADIFVCYDELNGDVIDGNAVNDVLAFKRARMRRRLEEEK
jgi:NTP pyrophosphatase (non-canonical NTP hydrolase)